MDTQHLWPLITIVLLGAFHGVYPEWDGCSRLRLGMQEK